VRTPHRLLPLLLLALAPTLAVGCGGGQPSESVTPTSAATAEPAESPAPGASRYTVATAAKEGTVQIYNEPDEAKKGATLKNPRLINDDPSAKVPLVMLVTDTKPGWYQVSLPIPPNGSKGWVKESDFKTSGHDFHMEVNLGAFNLKAFNGDEQIFEAPIGVAKEDTPTPGGSYYTTELLKPPDPNGAYGPFAYGLSGHSEKDLGAEFGDGQLGIHGTNEPQNIGKKISHGCIRLKNADITKLEEIGMPLGTPVVINA
jgi:lipoprotein-anchoring transpeptidase ErfK/SrfK